MIECVAYLWFSEGGVQSKVRRWFVKGLLPGAPPAEGTLLALPQEDKSPRLDGRKPHE